jgi:hypothetical protein
MFESISHSFCAEQQSFSTKTLASFLVEGTSIAGLAVKKSAGLKCTWKVSTGLQQSVISSESFSYAL